MKNSIWDIVFIVFTGILLVLLSETGNLDLVQKLPFVTIVVAYFIGRVVGQKRANKQGVKTEENV